MWYQNRIVSMTLESKSSMTSDMLHRAFHWSKYKLTPSFVGTVPSFNNRKPTLLDPFHSVNPKYLFPPRARLSGWMSTSCTDICKISCFGGLCTIYWVGGICTISAVGGICTISYATWGILGCCSVIWTPFWLGMLWVPSSKWHRVLVTPSYIQKRDTIFRKWLNIQWQRRVWLVDFWLNSHFVFQLFSCLCNGAFWLVPFPLLWLGDERSIEIFIFCPFKNGMVP